MITRNQIVAGCKALMDGWSGMLDIVVTRAKGAKLWDSNGKEYIDCTSQAFALNVGALNPQVVKAVKREIDRNSHVAASLYSVPLLLLSKKLTEISPADLNKVNFCLEGSLAVEGAIKLAIKNRPESKYLIAFEHGYHGRSFLTMAASWEDPDNPFTQSLDNIIKVPEAYCYRCKWQLEYPSCELKCAQNLEETIESKANEGVIAVLMEPVQGNGGQISFPPAFHKKVREICTKHDVILIWDEVQTAFGRVGKMFAAQLYDVLPDILVFGKAVGGGYPLAGFLARESLKEFGLGEHSFTFGYFPLSQSAAFAAIQILEEGDLLERCNHLNEYITSRLMKMQEKYETIGEVRGPGLAIGIEMVKNKESKEPAVEETNRILEMGLEKGILFGTSLYGGKGNVIKIKPPLVITHEEVERVLSVFEECVDAVS